MTYLHITPTGPEWPYTRTQLLAANPNVSFRYDLSAEELEPFGVLLVQPTNPPEHDPALQQPVEVHPQENDGQWFQAWELRDVPPVPRWVDFSAVIMALPAINVMLGAVLQAAPGLYGGLVVGLQQASEGDSRVFLNSWHSAFAMGLISEELIATVQGVAGEYDLPQEFIDSLIPA